MFVPSTFASCAAHNVAFCGRCTTAPVACEARVEVRPGRYNYVPVCCCGWQGRGYVAAHAAEGMAQAHQAGEV